MNILIDTYVLIWLTTQNKQLVKQTLQSLYNQKNNLFLSYFTLYKIAIKTAVRKLSNNSEILKKLDSASLNLLMPSLEDFSNYKIFNSNNKDPFNNMLLACAQTHNLSFVTANQ